jgi:aryl-alcohol dehydrogenase
MSYDLAHPVLVEEISCQVAIAGDPQMTHVTAAVLRERDQPYEIAPIDLPELSEHHVLVRIVGAGICHTDLLPRQGMLGSEPVVLGHEGAGVVERIGSAVAGLNVGDHVVLTFDSCGHCTNCLSAHPAYCESFLIRNFLGGTGDLGPATTTGGDPVGVRWFGQSSFATHAITTARNTVVVTSDAPLELLGPLGCSFLTGAASVTNVLDLQRGESVAVLGVGGVGMAAVLAAADIGAERIIAVDRVAARLELAAELGATHTIDASGDDDLSLALLGTGGAVSHVFDTTGHPRAIRAAVDAMAARGVCAIVGVQNEDLVLGPRSLANGKVVTAVYEGDAVPQIEIPRLISLWRSGRFPLERLVTTYPLSQINQAEQDLISGRVVKPVLLPDR